MIETRVRVLRQADGVSFVEATEHNGCGACASQESCGISGLGRFFSRRHQPVPLACGDLRPGQEVTVAVAEADLLKVGLWAYLLPVTLAVTAAAAAAGLGDAGAAAGAGLGLAAGLLLARRFAGTPKISITSGEQP
ncbi:SoxR reducing system RseC family protein [Parasulfuritortus cantonensis]|uniref:SoxR reducing system RseC family protein n=1 Tax=Parasulfuritortus cantonensis TaxID=2528202 RepID=UPI001404F96C|nr:SoxR reducing system RseC family protein [Parasulfuritortus cantonensis]